MSQDYEKNIFVNCPFDHDYVSLLRPIIFSIIYLGFNPRIASERFDSGELRFSKICSIIQESKYGIHDLSRMKAKKKGELFRFNMPFELGLDIGCRIFQKDQHGEKRHLILEEERYRYQAVISDLSNSDIKSHMNDPATVVRHIRNWLVSNGLKRAPSGTTIWYKFTDFMTDFYEKRTADGFHDEDIYDMPITEYIAFIKEWKGRNPDDLFGQVRRSRDAVRWRR